MSEKIIKKLMSIFEVGSQAELARLIEVDRSVISRWKKLGFPRSTRIIIELLISKKGLLK